MIESVKIKGLFGLYHYDIVVKRNDDKIHFLTAPNGYGKTTILDMVASVVRGEFKDLLNISFKQFTLGFDDGSNLSIDREESYQELKEDSDEPQEPKVVLTVSLFRKNQLVESFEVDAHSGDFDSSFSSDFRIDNRGINIDMFLRSMICDYITDARVLETKTDMGNEQGLFSKISLRDYSTRVKMILNDPVEIKNYSDRLDFFKKTIDNLNFANKSIELKPAFGFRFVGNDEHRAIIPLDKLSSGEKHIIIQLCELLFVAKEGALVLIDEPELSLHLAWQYQYLKIVEGIAALCGFQFIIATHSVQIFNAEWSRTTDLFMISKGKK